MTPEEINEKVARKLGWKTPAEVKASDPLVIFTKLWADPKGEMRQSNEIPDFCRSIEAAWEILTDHCDEWHLDCRGGVSARLQKNYVSGFAEADDAPMAICLAFLKIRG